VDRRERVIVALHRGGGAAAIDVPTKNTWAEGCSVSHTLVGEGQVSTPGSADKFHLSLNGNDVLIASCE
jgi:hypothetical protein